MEDFYKATYEGQRLMDDLVDLENELSAEFYQKLTQMKNLKKLKQLKEKHGNYC
jgi:hypothetical protein